MNTQTQQKQIAKSTNLCKKRQKYSAFRAQSMCCDRNNAKANEIGGDQKSTLKQDLKSV